LGTVAVPIKTAVHVVPPTGSTSSHGALDRSRVLWLHRAPPSRRAVRMRYDKKGRPLMRACGAGGSGRGFDGAFLAPMLRVRPARWRGGGQRPIKSSPPKPGNPASSSAYQAQHPLKQPAASGQAAAKARGTRGAVSMTRAPILRSLRRSVANSAVASAWTFGMVSRSARSSQ
jgi:hypothetical protein